MPVIQTNEQKHTPGPWSWGSGYTRYNLFDADNMIVLTASTDGELEVSDANARLIAAAPDMVATGLQLIEAACAIHPTAPSSDSIDRLHEAIDAHSAAIAKATGGQ